MTNDEITQAFIKALEQCATDEQRLEMLNVVTSFCCPYCGSFGSGECYCMRDD